MSQIQREKFIYIQEEILKVFNLNKYQIKYLFHTLYERKPEFQLIRFFQDEQSLCEAERKPYSRKQVTKKEESQKNNNSRESSQICIQMEVHDRVQQKNKFLEIYLVETFSSKGFEEILELVKRVSTFGQVDLIMNPIDSYFLNSDNSVLFNDDNTFFVIEYEMFDMTLRQYCKSFNIERNHIIDLLSQQCLFCQDISNIKIFDQDPQNIIQRFYIQIEGSEKIKLLLNLIHKNNSIFYDHHQILSNKEKQNQKKSEMINEALENSIKDLNFNTKVSNPSKSPEEEKTPNFLETKISQIEEYSLKLKKTKFKDMIKKLECQISKKDLIQKLPQLMSSQFSKHDPEIFKIIAQHPKYSSFEILTLDDHMFTFKVITKEKASYFLEVKKFKSLNDAQLLEKQYQSLINSLTPTKEITTVESVQVFLLSDIAYLLLEKKQRISLFNTKKYTDLTQYINILLGSENNLDKNKRSNSIQNTLFLEGLLDLTYSLIIKGNLPIHSINPENIYVNQSFENDKGEQQHIQPLIDQVTGGNSDFILEYYQLFEKAISRSYYLSALQRYAFDIIDSFFQAVSLQNQIQAQSLFINKVQPLFNRIKEIIKIEDQVFKQLKSGFIKIWPADSFLKKLNIEINANKMHEISTYKKELLSDYQFNVVNFNFSLKKIHEPEIELIFKTQTYANQQYKEIRYRANLPDEVSEEQLITELGQQNRDVIHEFFSDSHHQAKQRMIYSLITLCKDVQLEITLEMKDLAINFQQLIFMWSNEDEFQIEFNDDGLIENNNCLELTLKFQTSEYQSFEEKIKFIKTKKSLITLIVDSPFERIGAYQRYMNHIGMILIVKQANLYKNLLITFQEQFKINHCCQITEQIDMQLLLLQNQKSLQGLHLTLDIKRFSCCERMNSLLYQHQQLKYLELRLCFNGIIHSEASFEHQKMFYINLRKLLSPLKNLNYLKLQTNQTFYPFYRSRVQMFKLPRLVAHSSF